MAFLLLTSGNYVQPGLGVHFCLTAQWLICIMDFSSHPPNHGDDFCLPEPQPYQPKPSAGKGMTPFCQWLTQGLYGFAQWLLTHPPTHHWDVELSTGLGEWWWISVRLMGLYKKETSVKKKSRMSSWVPGWKQEAEHVPKSWKGPSWEAPSHTDVCVCMYHHQGNQTINHSSSALPMEEAGEWPMD